VVTGLNGSTGTGPTTLRATGSGKPAFETDDVQRCALHGAAQRQPLGSPIMLLEPNLASIFMPDYVGLMAEIYVSDPEHEKRATVLEIVGLRPRSICSRSKAP
jgi:hypothetical protein